MLSMLRITGNASAVVMLNGQTAGILTKGEMEQAVGGGKTLLQLFPLEKDCLPVTAILETGNPPMLTGAKGVVRLYVLSEHLLHLQVTFPRMEQPASAMPYILRRTASEQSPLQATVYFDRTFNFALERNGRILLSGAFSRELTEARFSRRRDFLLIEGICAEGVEFFAVETSAEPKVLLHHLAEKVSLREDLLEYALPLGELTAEVQYLLINKKQSRALRFSRPENHDLLKALLEAVSLEEEAFALSLIAPSLKNDASFADFRAFFGEYADLYDSASQKNEACLCYALSPNVFSVRKLRAAVKCEQIWNIEEI